MRRAWRRLAAATLLAASGPAFAQVQISGLNDVDFGSLPTTGADQTKTQSVCAYSGLLGIARYTVTATGSGSGGAFTLANGSATLPYEVQWAASAGQTSGTNLQPNTPLTGQSMLLNCLLGGTDASLVLIIRGTQIQQATAGSYNGSLTIILSAN